MLSESTFNNFQTASYSCIENIYNLELLRSTELIFSFTSMNQFNIVCDRKPYLLSKLTSAKYCGDINFSALSNVHRQFFLALWLSAIIVTYWAVTNLTKSRNHCPWPDPGAWDTNTTGLIYPDDTVRGKIRTIRYDTIQYDNFIYTRYLISFSLFMIMNNNRD